MKTLGRGDPHRGTRQPEAGDLSGEQPRVQPADPPGADDAYPDRYLLDSAAAR